MKNPWTKKNPFMSMWLSAANSVVGKVRGSATAEAKRQASTMMTKGMKDLGAFYLGAPKRRTTRKRKSR